MSLEATCSCHRCNALLRLVKRGRDSVHIEIVAKPDGEYALSGGRFCVVVPDFAPDSPGTVRERDAEPHHRYREHDKHCSEVPRPEPSTVKTRDVRPARIRRL